MLRPARFATRNFLLPAFLSILLLLFFIIQYGNQTQAAVTSCSASVSPTSVAPGTSASLTFSVTNSGPETANWVKINWNAEYYSATNFDAGSDWSSVSFGESELALWGGSLGAGSASSIQIDVTAAPLEVSDTGWNVQLSDDEGATTTNCGSLAIPIANATPAPTSTSSSTTTTTTTSTSTTTSSAATATPKPVEKIAPSISIKTDLSEPFDKAPEILGKATDTSRVVSVQYSVDGGANWLTPETEELGGKSVSFSFIPEIFEDGNYEIVVRAVDGVENTGRSKVYTLIIDRLPPLVGGNIWSIGPIPLLGRENGVIATLAGISNKITMSAVGGPISIDLLVDGVSYPMTKSASSGLWSGEVNFKSPGMFNIQVKSIDGADNQTLRDLNSVLVLNGGTILNDSGEVITGATVRVYKQDELSRIWSLWDGSSFGQSNPYVSGDDGGYSYLLPAGTYYLTASSTRYAKIASRIFKLNSPGVINSALTLKPQKMVSIGPLTFALPSIFSDVVDIAVTTPRVSSNEESKSSLIGAEILGFNLPVVNGGELNSLSLRGKSQIILFINTWLPGVNEQIAVIKKLDRKYQEKIFLIAVQENLSKTSVFVKRGGYDDLTFAVDPDGELVEEFKLNSFPAGYFIDRKGIVQRVTTGVIGADDIMKYLNSY